MRITINGKTVAMENQYASKAHSSPDDLAPHITDSKEYCKHLQNVSNVMNVPVQDRRHYNEDGSCKLCPSCGSDEHFKETVLDILNVHGGQGPAMETQIECTRCSLIVEYWAHGSYDPECSWYSPRNLS